MILNVLHLPIPSLIARSRRAIIDVSLLLPCMRNSWLHARTRTHRNIRETRARRRRGGGSVSRRTVGTRTGPGSGISGGRGTPSTPRMQPIYLDSRRVGLCAPSSSILEEVATCSVLYHRRFFHVTPNLSCRDDFWLFLFCWEEEVFSFFFFKSARIQRNFNFV